MTGIAMRFTRAIVRRPSRTFASGISSASEGPPDLAKALDQHRRYCDALRRCGLTLRYVEPEPAYPDGTFVEDTAIVTGRGAILTRPGAPSRSGEVDSVAAALREFYGHVQHITAPGTVDGGDVCEADGHFLIGISARTNAAGANQLAEHLRHMHYTASTVDIRPIEGLLHLKTGIAYLGGGVWVAAEKIHSALRSWSGLNVRELLEVHADEGYAANCARVNDVVLVAAGYPRVAGALRDKGFNPVLLELSEFRKMDGGLSCLSLRF
jgi:dimethylargininase